MAEADKSAREPTAATVSFVTTEHFTLQGARSQTVSEATGRASIFLASVSGGLVVDRLTVTHGTCRGAWIRRGQGPGVVRLSMSDAWCNILYA